MKQTILIYSQFIENDQAKLGQHYWMDTLPKHSCSLCWSKDVGWDHVGCLSQREREMLITQVETEVAVGRVSGSFGHDLLPRMYMSPVHMVPKPESVTPRLSLTIPVECSASRYHDISGICLDGIHSLHLFYGTRMKPNTHHLSYSHLMYQWLIANYQCICCIRSSK